MIYLASQPEPKKKTGIKKISSDLGLPAPFLAKILQLLAKRKILSSVKGPNGGFSLQKDPKKITLLDLVNSIDGEEIFTRCIMHSGSCDGGSNKKHCVIHDEYEKPRAELISLFSNTTVQQIVTKSVNQELIVF